MDSSAKQPQFQRLDATPYVRWVGIAAPFDRE
jgi:hypothetical protein